MKILIIRLFLIVTYFTLFEIYQLHKISSTKNKLQVFR